MLPSWMFWFGDYEFINCDLTCSLMKSELSVVRYSSAKTFTEKGSREVGLTLGRLQARRQSVARALSFAVTILGKWQVAIGDHDRLYGGTELVSTMILFTLDISINKG
jgi:hypothetical protein